MKKILCAALVLGLVFNQLALASNNEDRSTPGGEKAVRSEGPHHRVVQRASAERDRAGQVLYRTNQVVELATGMHVRRGNKWELADPSIQVRPDGSAEAGNAAHRVRFAPNLNSAAAVQLETPDAQKLSSRVIGLAYYDFHLRKSVLIAEVKDSIGTLVGTNELIYHDAFTDLKADVRYRNQRFGMEQDIILREVPPLPEDFGLNPKTTWLEVWTEFVDAPRPVVKQVTRRNWTKSKVDKILDFGTMQIIQGSAFSIGAEGRKDENIPVQKHWEKMNGRTFLIEEVSFSLLVPELRGLPKRVAALRTKGTGLVGKLSSERLLPDRKVVEKSSPHQKIRLAGMPLTGPALVIDYIVVNGGTDFVFQSDTTYHVTGPSYFWGDTRIEGGTVIKYATNASLNIIGTVSCNTGPYRPAIFTAENDNTVGESIVAGNNPSRMADVALQVENYADLSYVHIRYAKRGISGLGDYKVRHSQFIHCDSAVQARSAECWLRNVLMHDVGTGIGLRFATAHVEHLTFDQGNFLDEWLYDGNNECIGWNSAIYITNSIVTGGEPIGIVQIVYGDGVLVNPEINLYKTAGAGTHYLSETLSEQESPRNKGTTAIDPDLLQELKLKTTYAPCLVGQLAANARFSRRPGLRDTDAPDLGYHYDPLDFVISPQALPAQSLSLSNGVAVGLYGTVPLAEGANFSSAGGAGILNKVVWYNTVQEQSDSTWASATPNDFFTSTCLTNSTRPTINCQFTEFVRLADSLPAPQGSSFFNLKASALQLANCQFLNGSLKIDLSGCTTSSTSTVFNCLLERAPLNVNAASTVYSFQGFNNLFWNGSLALAGGSLQLNLADNLFDHTSISQTGGSGTADYNGYIAGANRVLPEGVHNVTLPVSPPYQRLQMGNFYYPEDWPGLRDLGSRLAAAAGLDQFTITSDLALEGASRVDIGFHYPNVQGPIIEVLPDPYITTHPASQTVEDGTAAVFYVSAGGSPSLSYQWRKNGSNLAGATASILTFASAHPSNDGTYSVRVSNASGTVTSDDAVLTVNASCYPAPGGMVSFWRGENNPNDEFDRYNGTASGVSYTNGWVGRAFAFDGMNRSVSFAADAGNFGTNDFTIECWLKTGATGNRAFLEKRPYCNMNGNVSWWCIRGGVSGSFGLEVSGASFAHYAGISTTVSLNDNLWHHVAWVRQNTTLLVYVDGILDNTVTSTGIANISSTTPVKLGVSSCIGADGTAAYLGNVDELAFFNRALSATEVLGIYNISWHGKCGRPVITQQPQSQTVTVGNHARLTVEATGQEPLTYQWTLNGTPVSGATDSALVLNDVQLANQGSYIVTVANNSGLVRSTTANLTVLTPTCLSPISGITHWWAGEDNAQDWVGGKHGTANGITYAQGRVGQAFVFAGTSPSVYFGDVGNFRTSDFSIQLWIKTTNGSNQAVLERRPACNMDSGPGWWGIRQCGRLDLEISGAYRQYATNLVTTVTLNDGLWHHVAWVRQGVTLSVFVDGQLNNQSITEGVADIDNSAALMMGESSCGGFMGDGTHNFNGATDEVQFYNRALSAAEIVAIYNAGGAGTCQQPVIIAEVGSTLAKRYGTTLTLQPVVLGRAPLTCQWRKNGIDLNNGGNVSGANTSSLTISNVVAADAGTYSLLVSNSLGTATTQSSVVTVMNLEASNFWFTISGAPGNICQIAVSTNGLQWILMDQVTLAGNLYTFVDTNAGPFPYRFYQVKNGGVCSKPIGFSRVEVPAEKQVLFANQFISPPNSLENFAPEATSYLQFYKLAYGQWTVGGLDPDTMTYPTTMTFSPGEAGFVQNGSSNTIVLNLMGELAQNSKVENVPADYTTWSARAPQNTTADLLGLTSTLADGDVIFQFDTASQSYYYNQLSGGVWIPNLPVFKVSEGFWIGTALPANWTNPGIPANCEFISPPTAAVAGGATICNGGSAVITAQLTGVGPWTVVWSDGTTQVSTTSSLSRTVTPSSDTTYRIVSLADSHCDAFASALTGAAVVTVHPRPTAQVTGDAMIYYGSSAQISAALTGSGPFTVVWSDGITNIIPGPICVRTVAPTSNIVYTVVSLSDAQCTALPDDLTGNAKIDVDNRVYITTEPLPQTNRPHANVVFTVAAKGAPPLSYQWRKNGVALQASTSVAGVTTPSLTLFNVLGANAGSYSVAISNPVDSKTSADAVLVVLDPSIISHPLNTVADYGATTAFSVQATGTEPFTYQWKKNGVNVTGATAARLVLANVTEADVATYSVTVTGPAGSSTSQNATLTLHDPVLKSSPQSLDLPAGRTAILDVSALGSGTLQYRWHKNGSDLSNGGNVFGATSSSLTISNLTQADAGIYSVTVSNAVGIVTSTPASLRVLEFVNNLFQFSIFGPTNTPCDIVASSNAVDWIAIASVELTNKVSIFVDPASSNYQHRFYRALSSDSSFTAFGFVKLSVPPRSGSGSGGSALIANQLMAPPNTLSMVLPNVPQQTTLSRWLGGSSFDTATFGANGWDKPNMTLGPGEGALIKNPSTTSTLRFTFMGQVMEEALSMTLSNTMTASLMTPRAGTADDFALTDIVSEDDQVIQWNVSSQSYFTNTFTVTGWNPAIPTFAVGESFLFTSRAEPTFWLFDAGSFSFWDVIFPPNITWLSPDHRTCLGLPVEFSVIAEGSEPLSYQWRKNGVNLADDDYFSGTASSSLLLSEARLLDAGTYSVVISNLANCITSQPVTLTLVDPTLDSDYDGQPDFQEDLDGTDPLDAADVTPVTLGHWSFVGAQTDFWRGENDAQDEIGSNHGAWIGTSNYAAGLTGQAFHFTGSNAVSFGTAPGNFMNNDTSVSFWMKTAVTNNAVVFGKRQSVDQSYWTFSVENRKLRFDLAATDPDMSPVTMLATNIVTDSNWHSVLWTRQGSRLSLYIDGRCHARASFSGFVSNNSALHLAPPAPAGQSNFIGDLDEVGLFGQALWMGDDGQAPLSFTNIVSVPSWAGGALGLSSSSNSSITFRNVESNGTPNINLRCGSVSLRFKPNWSGANTNSGTGPGLPASLVRASVSPDKMWRLGVTADGTQLLLQTQTNSTVVTHLTADIRWLSNEWHHLVVTYTPSNSVLFIDGSPVQIGTGISNAIPAALRTNGWSLGGCLGGDLCDLTTFNYPLTADAVSALTAAPVSTGTPVGGPRPTALTKATIDVTDGYATEAGNIGEFTIHPTATCTIAATLTGTAKNSTDYLQVTLPTKLTNGIDYKIRIVPKYIGYPGTKSVILTITKVDGVIQNISKTLNIIGSRTDGVETQFGDPIVLVAVKTAKTKRGSTIPAAFTISRNQAKAYPLAVRYRMAGLAQNGLDYVDGDTSLPLSGVAVIPANATTVILKVKAVNSWHDITTKTYDARLVIQPDAAYTIKACSAFVTIENNQTVNLLSPALNSRAIGFFQPDDPIGQGYIAVRPGASASQPGQPCNIQIRDLIYCAGNQWGKTPTNTILHYTLRLTGTAVYGVDYHLAPVVHGTDIAEFVSAEVKATYTDPFGNLSHILKIELPTFCGGLIQVQPHTCIPSSYPYEYKSFSVEVLTNSANRPRAVQAPMRVFITERNNILDASIYSGDTDEDGLKNWEETDVYFTLPHINDTDGDGLSDGDEVAHYKTNPRLADTDGDLLSDGYESNAGKKPLDSTDGTKDGDLDGVPFGLEIQLGTQDTKKATYPGFTDYELAIMTFGIGDQFFDTDGDGFDDNLELLWHTDPFNPAIHPPMSAMTITASIQ